MSYLKLICQKIKNWLKSLSWQEIALFVLILIIGLPSLFVSWMIVDDGVGILIPQKISNLLTSFNFGGLWDLFVEKESGRFRPAYWIFQWVVYLIGREDPFFHHFVHFLVCAATVFLIFSIIRILTSSKSSALLGSSLFLLTYLNIENWYRLGPQEPLLVFYLTISLYFLAKNISLILGVEKKISKINLLFSILPLALAYFTKETPIALMPLAVFFLVGAFLIKDRKRKTLWLKNFGYFLMANLFLTIISLIIIFFVRHQGYYSAYYTISLPALIGHARGYFGLIFKSFGIFSLIYLFSFFYFSFLAIKRGQWSLNQFLQLAFLVGFFSFLLIFLPWGFVLGRYLESALVFLVFACGFENARIFDTVSRRFKEKISWGFFLAFLFFLVVNLPPVFSYVVNTVVGTHNTREFLRFIARITPPGGRVFFNMVRGEATVELVFESDLHFKLFDKRQDITADYIITDENKLQNLKKRDIIVTAFTSDNFIALKREEFLKKFKFKELKQFPNQSIDFTINIFSRHPFYRFNVLRSIWFVDMID